jgi:hypothetical protein
VKGRVIAAPEQSPSIRGVRDESVGKLETFVRAEEEILHEATLRVLSEVGVKVESDEVLERLADFGAQLTEQNGWLFSLEVR